MKKLSKKNNRKNRALKHIRNKNFISRGNIVTRTMKITLEASKDLGLMNLMVQDMHDKTIIWLKKKYKIKFFMAIAEVSVSQIDNDFIKQLFTLAVCLRRKGF